MQVSTLEQYTNGLRLEVVWPLGQGHYFRVTRYGNILKDRVSRQEATAFIAQYHLNNPE